MPMSFVILASIPIKLVRVCYADSLRERPEVKRRESRLGTTTVEATGQRNTS